MLKTGSHCVHNNNEQWFSYNHKDNLCLWLHPPDDICHKHADPIVVFLGTRIHRFHNSVEITSDYVTTYHKLSNLE